MSDYLVTGGTGFLGEFVVRRLVTDGAEVAGLARSSTAEERLRTLGARPIRGDLDDAAATVTAFEQSGASALINVASLGFGHAPIIVDAAETVGITRAVFVSTTAIFTALNAPSKATRIAAEETVTNSSLEWTILRPTMIYGTPGDRNIWRLLQLLRRTPVVPLPGGGHHLQQPVHVADLADAVVAASAAPQAVGTAVNVPGPEALTFRQIVRQAAAAVDRRPRTFALPVQPIIRTLQMTEKRGLKLPLKAEQFQRLTEDKAFDVGPARDLLGHSPRSFAEGVRQEAAMGPHR